MNVKVKKGALNGIILAPPSKSVAHRALISAFLSKNTVVVGYDNGDDITTTRNGLKELENANGHVTINCRESGSTLRFLLPLAAALGVNVTFTGTRVLLSRPITALVDLLNKHGATIRGLTVNGKLTSGDFEVDATISSQFITGLMLALPILDGDSKIIFKGVPVSASYLDITKSILKEFGIRIEDTDYGFYVYGNQKYRRDTAYVIEGDYSGSAFMLASAAINGKVSVKNLKADSTQGDRKILSILKNFGAKVSEDKNVVTVEKDRLYGRTIDCEDTPDLAQILAVVGAYAKGQTKLVNVERLALKESNRINAIIEQLTTAGIECDYKDGTITINGGKPKGGIFSGGNDHRTAMSATILALHADGESQIIGAEVVKKSYVNFFNDVKTLGGDVNVLF